MASLWPDLDAQAATRRVREKGGRRVAADGTHTVTEQLTSSGGATEREEEGGQLTAPTRPPSNLPPPAVQLRGRKKGGSWLWRGRKKGGDARSPSSVDLADLVAAAI
jgi:hypothetical protein